jgi:hypothetical protein
MPSEKREVAIMTLVTGLEVEIEIIIGKEAQNILHG